MALKFTDATRNASLNAIRDNVGSSAKLKIFKGSAPATAATAVADSTELLCTINLPATWFDAASGGQISKTGTWSGTAGSVAGSGTTAGWFRIVNSAEGSSSSTLTGGCIQGTISLPGAGGDMTLDNTSLANGQTVTVNTFTIRDNNG